MADATCLASVYLKSLGMKDLMSSSPSENVGLHSTDHVNVEKQQTDTRFFYNQ